MGDGITYWWINDGPVTSDLQTTFQLNKGNNYIYFACIGFRVYFYYLYFDTYFPRADISSTVFILTDNIPTKTPFSSTESFVLILSLFALIRIINRKRK